MGQACRALTDDEIVNVINYLDTARDRALFIVGLRTGFRVSELITIRVQDVYSAGQLATHLMVGKAKMKGKAKGRKVKLHPQAIEFIKHLIDSESLLASDFLFQSRKGLGAITRGQAWRVLKVAYAAAGVQNGVATHSMRKTFATKVYEASGKDIRTTQVALGHVSVNSTVNYLAVEHDEVDDLVSKLK